jgi:ribosomal protein S12 methylthiotransferase accessory factor
MMDMIVRFPGGVKVEADYKGFKIKTDQPDTSGGEGSAPSPFDLFIASIGTCVGYYVLTFCKARGIQTENSSVILKPQWNNETKMMSKIIIDIVLPANFPPKYSDAVLSAANHCTVKKYVVLDFSINVIIGGARPNDRENTI